MTPDDIEPRVLAFTREQAAEYLTSRGYPTSKRQLRRWFYELIGPTSLKAPGQRRVYLRRDLDAFIEMLESYRQRTVMSPEVPAHARRLKR